MRMELTSTMNETLSIGNYSTDLLPGYLFDLSYLIYGFYHIYLNVHF